METICSRMDRQSDGHTLRPSVRGHCVAGIKRKAAYAFELKNQKDIISKQKIKNLWKLLSVIIISLVSMYHMLAQSKNCVPLTPVYLTCDGKGDF